MKRNLGSGLFVTALAVSFSLCVPVAQADWQYMMNPLHWFSRPPKAETAQASDLKIAQQQALEAQAQADMALKSAQEALRKAQDAQRKAAALQVKEKPVVKTPVTAEGQWQAFESRQPVNDQLANNQETVASEAETQAKSWWHPWQHKMEKTENTEAMSSELPQRQDTPEKNIYQAQAVAEQASTLKVSHADGNQTQPETAKREHLGTPWNPLNWFAKPAPYTPEATETATKQSKTIANNAQPLTLSPVASDAVESSGEVDLKTKAALLETEKGNIAFELYPDQAPETVANFAKLVSTGFYNRFNMKFHRVVPGFVIQTGDPTGTGAGGSKDRVPLETKNKLSHNAKGIVAMARGADPNSATSQFYITLAPQTTLDGKYAIFGRVISGLDVLDKIEKDDMLYGIRLVELNSIVRDAQPEKKKFFSSLF